jgi:hypothetical protein
VAISTRLCTTPDEEWVPDRVAAHLGRLRRADLAAVSCAEPVDAELSGEERRAVRRCRLNARKKALTGQSSARWANAIIAANDDQCRLARDAQYRHIIGLGAAIATIDKRLAAPTTDVLTAGERKARRKAKAVKGYVTQAERFAKQRRLQHLRGELARAHADRSAHRVHVVEGGKRLAKTRHHLDDAELTVDGWRDQWGAARYRITANGSPDEPFGNLTITVTRPGRSASDCPNRWNTWPMPHVAATSSRAVRCSLIAARNGHSGSPVQCRCPTPSHAAPAAPAGI